MAFLLISEGFYWMFHDLKVFAAWFKAFSFNQQWIYRYSVTTLLMGAGQHLWHLCLDQCAAARGGTGDGLGHST